MEYFFSRLGRSLRYSATILGSLACGTVIVLGIMGINTIVVPICGGIALIPMAMVMFENVKAIRDLENNVSAFKSENKKLKETNENLKITENKLSADLGKLEHTNNNLEHTNNNLVEIKNNLIEQNSRYEKLLDESEINLNSMTELANKYKATSLELSNNLHNSTQNLELLKSQALELINIKNEYQKENKILNENIKKVQDQLDQVTQAKEAYEIQLIKLSDTNNQLSDSNNQLSEIATNLRSELEKAKASYEDAKSALKTLLQATGVLADLGNDMVQTEHKTEQNVSTMSKLLSLFGMSRSEEMFNKLDKDNNKVLTVDEFVNIIFENPN